jgi:branched-chain amino acid transport system permease protein
VSRGSLTWAALAVALFVVIPLALSLAGSGYAFRVVATVLIFAILSVSMHLIMGVGGLFSLGHGAFYGIGAYAAALLSTKAGLPFVATLPLAGLAAALLGALVALPTMRLVSIYFAVATLGIGQMIFVTLLNWVDFTGGPLGIRGIPPPSLFGLDLSDALGTYMVCAAITAFTVLVAHRCGHGYYGNALRALREDDQCAGAMGIDTVRLKIEVFSIACFLAGLAGALWSHTTGFISPNDFAFPISILILAMVVVGGLGSLPGALIGAALLILLPELLRPVGDVRQIAVGAVMFGCILFLPKGLFGEVSALAFARRQLGAAWTTPDGRLAGWR